MFQTNCIVCIKRQSQSQLIVRSAVITSVMSVLLCGQEIGVSHNATTGLYVSWRVSILKDRGMSQTQYAVCIKRQSQSQLIVRSAVITSVMSVLLCREMSGELFLSGAGHDTEISRSSTSLKEQLPGGNKKRGLWSID